MRRRGSEPSSSSVGKSGIEYTVTTNDQQAVAPPDGHAQAARRLPASPRLPRDSRWADLDAAAVNAYIPEMVHEDLYSQGLPHPHATILLAVALAESPERGGTKASRKRAVKAAIEEVAAYLGNTPTIARKSYIDPRVIEQYEDGVTIAGTLRQSYPDQARARQPSRRRSPGSSTNAD